MAARRAFLIALCAMLLVGALVPTAQGDHCRTKLVAYGRMSTAPIASPPYMSSTAGVCLALYGRGVDDHVLPPGTDQVMVRVNGEFGGIPSILIQLDGLGFTGHTYSAVRTQSPFGGNYYQLPEWVALPAGPQSGTLVVTAYYPSITVSETYHTYEAPAAPASPV